MSQKRIRKFTMKIATLEEDLQQHRAEVSRRRARSLEKKQIIEEATKKIGTLEETKEYLTEHMDNLQRQNEQLIRQAAKQQEEIRQLGTKYAQLEDQARRAQQELDAEQLESSMRLNLLGTEVMEYLNSTDLDDKDTLVDIVTQYMGS